MAKNMDNIFISGTYSDDEDGIDEDRNPDDEESKRMLEAAENGDVELVKSLLNTRKDLVNVTDKEGYTPLHRACYSNHRAVAEILLQNGANIGAKTEMKWEPLHSSCRWGSIECAQLLLQEGADINAKSEGGQTPLHIAAAQAACNLIQLLLLHPFVDAQAKNGSGETAFDILKRSTKFRNIFDMSDPLFNIHTIESV